MMQFWIERQRNGQWERVNFAASNSVKYCHGYVDAMSTFYPSDPYRICRRDTAATFKVLREFKGHGKVHTNTGGGE